MKGQRRIKGACKGENWLRVHEPQCKKGGLQKGLEGLGHILYQQGGFFSPVPHSCGYGVTWPASPKAPLSLSLEAIGKVKLSGYTHLVSSESGPQGKLLIPLQEADLHIVDLVPVKHHQHVGLGPGLGGTVSDQERAILKQKAGRGCCQA